MQIYKLKDGTPVEVPTNKAEVTIWPVEKAKVALPRLQALLQLYTYNVGANPNKDAVANPALKPKVPAFVTKIAAKLPKSVTSAVSNVYKSVTDVSAHTKTIENAIVWVTERIAEGTQNDFNYTDKGYRTGQEYYDLIVKLVKQDIQLDGALAKEPAAASYLRQEQMRIGTQFKTIVDELLMPDAKPELIKFREIANTDIGGIPKLIADTFRTGARNVRNN